MPTRSSIRFPQSWRSFFIQIRVESKSVRQIGTKHSHQEPKGQGSHVTPAIVMTARFHFSSIWWSKEADGECHSVYMYEMYWYMYICTDVCIEERLYWRGRPFTSKWHFHVLLWPMISSLWFSPLWVQTSPRSLSLSPFLHPFIRFYGQSVDFFSANIILVQFYLYYSWTANFSVLQINRWIFQLLGVLACSLSQFITAYSQSPPTCVFFLCVFQWICLLGFYRLPIRDRRLSDAVFESARKSWSARVCVYTQPVLTSQSLVLSLMFLSACKTS